MPIAVAIYVFPNVEILDFAGPFEVFTTASRVHQRLHPEERDIFWVFTVARTTQAIQARAGLKLLPDYSLSTCPDVDVLVIPGGVVDAEVADGEVVAWVNKCARRSKLTASVCTGSFILAKAGILDGKKATTHWEDITDLRTQFPNLDVCEGVRWVDEGNVITSAGIAAGIDMSLHLVSRLCNPELASATARQMDVPYQGDA